MISVAETLELLKINLPKPKETFVPLSQAYSRRLAQDILDPEPSPRFTSSAMDGFAFCWQQTSSSENPTALQIVGESQAGIPYDRKVSAGEAVRISTGAMLPDGADTVIRVEDTSEEGGKVFMICCTKKGQDVRRQGEEFQRGSKLLSAGTVLKARQIALLSSVGVEMVQVYAIPKVSLFHYRHRIGEA